MVRPSLPPSLPPSFIFEYVCNEDLDKAVAYLSVRAAAGRAALQRGVRPSLPPSLPPSRLRYLLSQHENHFAYLPSLPPSLPRSHPP